MVLCFGSARRAYRPCPKQDPSARRKSPPTFSTSSRESPELNMRPSNTGTGLVVQRRIDDDRRCLVFIGLCTSEPMPVICWGCKRLQALLRNELWLHWPISHFDHWQEEANGADLRDAMRFSKDFNVSRISLPFKSTIAVASIIIGNLFLDLPLAAFVAKSIGVGFLLSHHVSNIPDILFVIVCLITVVGWGGHLYFARRPTSAISPDFFLIIGTTAPFSFVLKDVAKHLVGRTNTRLWLTNPEQYGFHWFHGGGNFSSFPSGHMAVFTALMIGISRFYPRFGPVGLGFLLCLALALIATEHHFLSDVVAGAYLGFIVDHLTCRGLLLIRRVGSPITGPNEGP